MNVLALDCSTDILAVAVARGYDSAVKGPQPPKHPYREDTGHAPAPGPGLVTVSVDAGFRHAERIMGCIEFCLAEAGLAKDDIDLFACAGGPGSFTGLRIAMATVKGLALGTGKPFVVVPTLDAYAAEWAGAAPIIIPVLDAKRSRFFHAVYESGILISGPHDESAQSMLQRVNACPEVLFVGPDLDLIEELAAERSGFRTASVRRRSPIGSIIDLALVRYKNEGPAPSDAAPNYLRTSDAEEMAAAVKA